jgi:manganese oxidase
VPETTVLVPVGSARVIAFVAAQAGDWPIHCHMTHHVMTQMGHGLPTMLGADTRSVEPLIRGVVPGSMVMGTRGMGGMDEMHMPVPSNSTPMRGGRGPFGTIDMGGMFTILKVRNELSAASSSSWYRHPPGTIARPAEPARMIADGIP